MKNLQAVILLFVANTVSGMAQGISMLAIPWYFAKEGSMDSFGLVYILSNVVSLFWIPYAGVLTDRFNRKHIFLIVSIVGGSIMATLALVGHAQAGLPFIAIAMGFVFTFFNYNIHYPNLYAFVQEITEPRHYRRVTTALEIQGQVTTMLAGAGGAMLLEGTINGQLNIFGFFVDVPFHIDAWEIYDIFTLDAGTYFTAFFILLLMRYKPLVVRNKQMGNTLARLKTGIQYLRTHKYVTIFGLASYAVFVVILIEGFYLGPMYVSNHLMAQGDVFASSEMYYALGAITAGMTVLRFVRGKKVTDGVILLTFLAALTCFMLAFTNSVVLFYFALLMLGLTNSGTRVLRVNYLFSVVPNDVYGRVNSIFAMFNTLARVVFISLFALPFFIKDNHVIYSLGILGVFLVVSGLVLIRYYRKFEVSNH